ncbi:MAG: polyphosphate polymerase domain-containing protein [Vallitaleaceae bacterium]|jgi:SPX domain protein involved in polyphosphate accumulation|nr:polyphosphate polymerase domain-containing protein [Vallitaleaceae bacterium]
MATSKGKRHEIKYTINYFDYLTYSGRLKKILKEDHSVNGEGYEVTSIYFDDRYNTAYLEKIRGDEFRSKYRLRYYNDEQDFYKLEKKEKWQRMTVKSSTQLEKKVVDEILLGNYQVIADSQDTLVREFYYGLTKKMLRPKTVIRYHRNAYMHPIGEFRLTLDTDIRFGLYRDNIPVDQLMYMQAIENNEVIMELKFDGVLPSMISNMIQASRVISSSSSKYVYSRQYDYNY